MAHRRRGRKKGDGRERRGKRIQFINGVMEEKKGGGLWRKERK